MFMELSPFTSGTNNYYMKNKYLDYVEQFVIELSVQYPKRFVATSSGTNLAQGNIHTQVKIN
jgi:hypothetical protein